MQPRSITRYFHITGLVVVLILSQNARVCADEGASEEEYFSKGAYSASIGCGYLFSPFLATGGRPAVNYSLTEVRLGYMLTDTLGPGWLRGNVETGLQIFGGAIMKGGGDYLAGGGPWLRYHFVPKQWRLTPFVQIGAGVVWTDVDPNLQGQDFNFNLEGSAGLRYSLSARSALSLEFRYQHISNAGLADRNLGINACGPMLSFAMSF